MPLDVDIFGQGIYSPRQAARLIGSSAQDVLRWTRGSGPTQPLWHAHYQTIDNATEISFSDLIELRLVSAFRRAGVSLQAIRFAIQFAQEKFSVDHPLSSLGFKTDGDEILMEAIEKDGEMVSLAKTRAGQKVFTKLIEQSLNDLEYDNKRVLIWRPKTAKTVVIDPTRSFGSPILDDFGVSTKTLFDEVSGGLSPAYVSKAYEIPIGSVSDAVNYEHKLKQTQEKMHGQSTF